MLLITVEPSYDSVLELSHFNGLCAIICLRTRILFKVIPWEVNLKLQKKLKEHTLPDFLMAMEALCFS